MIICKECGLEEETCFCSLTDFTITQENIKLVSATCDRCNKDISNVLPKEEKYDSEVDLMVCEACYNNEIVFSTLQKQRRISTPKEKAYIIYEGKKTGIESLPRQTWSSFSNPSAQARKIEKEQEKRITELEKENVELKERLNKMEELVQQLLNTSLEAKIEQLPK